MAVLGSFELIACKELAIKYKATAHTCSYEEARDILIAFGSAVFILTQNSYVYIIANIERHTEFFLNRRLDIIVLPWQIRGKEYDTVFLVYNARSPCCYSIYIFFIDSGFLYKLVNNADYDFFYIAGALSAFFGLLLEPVSDIFFFVKDCSQNLGSADIKAYVVLVTHAFSSSLWPPDHIFSIPSWYQVFLHFQGHS